MGEGMVGTKVGSGLRGLISKYAEPSCGDMINREQLDMEL
jgi:hypothetical protein